MERTLPLFDDSDVAVLPKPKTGAQFRDAGMAQAVDNANAVVHDWSDRALEFVRQIPKSEFMTEDVREYAYSRGLPVPPDDRSWGAVITAAKRLGIITFDRFESVNNPKAHRRPASVWRKS